MTNINCPQDKQAVIVLTSVDAENMPTPKTGALAWSVDDPTVAALTVDPVSDLECTVKPLPAQVGKSCTVTAKDDADQVTYTAVFAVVADAVASFQAAVTFEPNPDVVPPAQS